MTIAFTLSMPEHTTIIEHYEQILGDNIMYHLEWAYNVLPRIGENIDGPILNQFLQEVMKAKENLPMRWHVTDVKWSEVEGILLPVIHTVAKWGPA